jgi:hypothetical protein
LLSLHFQFNDIDAATKLVLDMNSSNNCCSNEEYRNRLQKPCVIAVGSPNLKNALKKHIKPELLQKNSVLKLEGREGLVFYNGEKLAFSNGALVKFIIGYKKEGRISELSKLSLSIQGELYSATGSRLCSDGLSLLMTFWTTQRLPGLQWVSICIFYIRRHIRRRECKEKLSHGLNKLKRLICKKNCLIMLLTNTPLTKKR